MPRRPPSPVAPLSLDEACDLADQALADGDGKLAERHARTALELDQASVDAHLLCAAALDAQGEPEKAAAAYRGLLRRFPKEPRVALSAADFLLANADDDPSLLEEALTLARRSKAQARRAGDDELCFELCLLGGVALNQLGRSKEALAELDEALALAPDATPAKVERAIALFELCRFEEAEPAFEEVLASFPDDGSCHHYLGLIAERRGSHAKADRHFAKARELSPDDFPRPISLGDAEFDAELKRAIDRLPADAKKHLSNVTITVQPIPSDEELVGADPPLSPTILGVFRGTPVGERSISSAADHGPVEIVLYQRNLERFARSASELREQIGVTLMHEVGHLLGLDEDDLWERGLD